MIQRSLRPVLLIAVLLGIIGTTLPAAAQGYGNQRRGMAGFQSLVIPVDARGAAMGRAVVTTASDASSLFWNPALAAQATMDSPYTVGLATTRYHAETSLHYIAGIGRLDTPLGQFNIGLGLQAFDGGRMDETTELMPEGTGRTFGYVEWAGGLTVSQALTEDFSYGVTAKFVQLSTAEVRAQTVVFDLGVYYNVGETGARIGVAIRNFGIADADPSGEMEVVGTNGTFDTITPERSITPPTQFLLGISYDLFQRDEHAVIVAGQINSPADGEEQISLGAEYIWNETLAFRTGYQFGVDEASLPSFGVGFMLPDFGGPDLRIDYGFSHRDRLGSLHTLGLNVRF